MKKRLLLLVVFAVLLSAGLYGVGGVVPAAHARSHSQVSKLHASGPTAQAGFSISSGDIAQSVSVFASTESLQMEPGKPVHGSSIGVSIVEFNKQAGVVFFVADAPLVSVPGLFIDGKGLTGASLPLTTVTMTVRDPNTGDPTGQTFPLTVALTWTGVGDISTNRSVSHFEIPGIKETIHSSGSFRNATADANTLSYTLPDGRFVNFSGTTSEFANLSNNRFMDILIMH